MTLLNPILNHRSSAITKDNLYKGERVITVQGPEWSHTDGHVISGVVRVLPEMKPFYLGVIMMQEHRLQSQNASVKAKE